MYSRESILRAYGINSKVCYLGIDSSLFVRRNVPKTDEIVGMGAFLREKNIEFVIKAVGAVDGVRPRLTWIGNVASASYLDGLKRLAEECGVSFDPKIRIADDELVEILSRAVAFVYASRLEPFGLSPLEAGACGLPVIAVAEGGVRETVIDRVTGLLVEHDPRAMARAIERLRDDPAYAATLGEAAHREVRDRWGLSGATDRLEQRFEELLRGELATG
jgi:glycosyltransferase involved in cell wall biosynthesis